MTQPTFNSAAGRPSPPVAMQDHIEPYDTGNRQVLVDIFLQWLQAKRDDLKTDRPEPVQVTRQPTKYERQRYATRTGIVLYKAGQPRPPRPPARWHDHDYKAGLWSM